MKRYLCALTAIVMLFSMMIFPVSAETTVDYATCPHCGEAWDSCGWESFDTLDLDEPVPSGHYYLTQDTETSVLTGIGAYDGQSQQDATDVVLDLRGYDLSRTSSNARAVYVYDYSVFSLMDSVGGGTLSGNGNVVGGNNVDTSC